MGLADDIETLEARYSAGHDVTQELAEAYAKMISRKSSQRLVWAWYEDLRSLMKENDRYNELIKTGNGVDPYDMGWRDCQATVEKWLEVKNER